MSIIIYCKDRRRRPVQLGVSPALRDVQADIPLAWCSQCGSEIFLKGQQQCRWCRSTKGEIRK